MKIKYFYLFLLVCITSFGGCKKFIEIDPPVTSSSGATVYETEAAAASVLTGIYGKMVSLPTGFSSGRQGISISAGLSADELQSYSNSGPYHLSLYANAQDVNVQSIWNELYQYIYVANAALEGLSRSIGFSDSARKRLSGEARFIRAFNYFYLVNLWGDVPLIITTDYHTNQSASRTPPDSVYSQIIRDLEVAKNLLGDNFVTPLGAVTTERVRPNKAAATALLARVYLYLGNWEKAEALSTEVINSARYSLLANPASTFLMNSTEAIWQLPPVTSGINTYDGNTLIRTTAPGTVEPVSLSSYILSAFEPGDNRKTAWVDSMTISGIKYHYPKKYKVKGGPAATPVTEYLMVLRLAEQYLIRAEARAEQGKLAESRNDLLALRRRAGLADSTLSASDKVSLLKAIMHERQTELFTEWGHRWLDLKRTRTMDAIMSVICLQKGAVWNTNRQLYPIPASEILLNPNLTQNPSY